MLKYNYNSSLYVSPFNSSHALPFSFLKFMASIYLGIHIHRHTHTRKLLIPQNVTCMYMISNLNTWYGITKLGALFWGWLFPCSQHSLVAYSSVSRTGHLWNLVCLLMVFLFRPNLGSHIVDFFMGVASLTYLRDEILQKSRHSSFSYKL